jgi:ubiquinone/menaquinone biosynthesis C-methylase UbiE
LQTAPLHEELEKGIKVLDIGCGPGWWSIDMARKYPKSQFIGIDITANFRQDETLQNVSYQVINAGTGLPFSDDAFDYVFQRFLVMGFSVEQYRLVINEIMRVLKPGGTIEILEMVSKYNDAGPWFQTIGEWSEYALGCSIRITIY